MSLYPSWVLICGLIRNFRLTVEMQFSMCAWEIINDALKKKMMNKPAFYTCQTNNNKNNKFVKNWQNKHTQVCVLNSKECKFGLLGIFLKEEHLFKYVRFSALDSLTLLLRVSLYMHSPLQQCSSSPRSWRAPFTGEIYILQLRRQEKVNMPSYTGCCLSSNFNVK